MAQKILKLVVLVGLIHALKGAPQAPPDSTNKGAETTATSATTLAGSATEMEPKPREVRAAIDDEKKGPSTVKTLADIPNAALVNKDTTGTTASSGEKEIVRKARGTEKHSDEDDEDVSYTKIPPKHEESHEDDSEEESSEEEEAVPTKESEYEYHQDHEHERHSRQAGSAEPSSSSEESTETQTSDNPDVSTVAAVTGTVNL